MSIKVIRTNNVHVKWTISKESDMSKGDGVNTSSFLYKTIN